MKYGLPDPIIESIQQVLETNPKLDKALLFGSRAKGNYREASDIDLAVKGQNLNYDDLLSLGVKLDDLNLPYKVDLIDYHSIKEPALTEHIDRVGIEFYNVWQETKIGKIPSYWKLMTLDEIKSKEKKSIISGPFGSNISSKYFAPEGIPVVRGNNLSLDLGKKFNDDSFVFITEEKANELGTWAVKDDIIFTAVGTIGQVGILLGNEKFEKYIISNKQLRLRVDQEIVSPLYAYYWFASPAMIDTIEQRNTGSSVPLINLSVLKSLYIPIPPKYEQELIVEVLSSLDDKIDLLHRQNKTLEQLAETLFRQWFVEEAEESWEVVRVCDVAGINSRTLSKSYPYSEIEYLDTGSITDGSIEAFQTCKLKDAPSRAQRIVVDDDIVYSLVRPIQRHFGLLHGIKPNTVASTGFCTITCKDISPYFIYLLLTSDENVEYFEMIAEASTSAYPSLKPSDISNFEFLKPSMEKLSEFSELTSNTWSKIKSNKNQIRSLIQLRDTLLPKLMSGEVRVNI